MAIINSMDGSFPRARFQGCYFHFGQVFLFFIFCYSVNNDFLFYQNIYKKACKLGLKIPYATFPEVETIVKMLITIALVPPLRVEEAMEVYSIQK